MTGRFGIAFAALFILACAPTVQADEQDRKAVLITGASTGLGRAMPENLPHAFDAGWEGRQTCEVLFEDDTQRIARCVFPPGIGHEKHYHNPHWGYVLEGSTLRIMDDNGERTVTTETGGSWSTDTVTVHEALNIGDSTTSYLIVESKVD